MNDPTELTIAVLTACGGQSPVMTVAACIGGAVVASGSIGMSRKDFLETAASAWDLAAEALQDEATPS